MKIKIPFKLFGKQRGWIEMGYSPQLNLSMEQEELEMKAQQDAEKLSQYLGVLKDELQRGLLAYERCPGIEKVFQTLIDCEKDEIIHARLLELYKERMLRDE